MFSIQYQILKYLIIDILKLGCIMPNWDIQAYGCIFLLGQLDCCILLELVREAET